MSDFYSDKVLAETSLQCGGIEAALRYQQVVYVKKNPGPGEFSSVVTAMASITDASSTKIYSIQIGPGEYTENNPIVCKPYVFIMGISGSLRCTKILAANANADLLQLTDNFFICDLFLSGVTGSGFSLVKVANSGSNFGYIRVFNCAFGSSDTLVTITANSSFDTEVIIESCIIGGYQFNKGILIDGTGTKHCNLVLKSMTLQNLISTQPSYILYTKNAATVTILGGEFHSDEGLSTGNCFQADSGAKLEIIGSKIAGFTKGIYTINSGVAPEMSAMGVYLEYNTIDLQIDHVGTKGLFSGSATFSKIVNNAPATTSFNYSDPDIGDFNISRTAHMRGVATDILLVPSAASTTQLLNTDPFSFAITGSTPGKIMVLPNATTVRNGHQVWVINSSTVNITSQQFGGSNAIILIPTASVHYILEDNTTSAGIWYRAVSTSSPFTGTAPIIAGYGGNANIGRFLEFVSGNPSDGSPFIAIHPYTIVGMSVSGNGISTCTVSLYKNGNFVTSIGSLSTVGNNNQFNNTMVIPLAEGDLLTIGVSAGSINKPFVAVYLAGA